MLSKKILESIPKSIRILRTLSTENLNRSLSLQQLRVLNLILEGQGQTSISESLQVSLAAISKMVESLVKKDLVTRKVGKDKRTYELRLTSKGKKLMDQVTAYVQKKIDEGITSLNQQEKQDLMKGLLILDGLMDKVKKV